MIISINKDLSNKEGLPTGKVVSLTLCVLNFLWSIYLYHTGFFKKYIEYHLESVKVYLAVLQKAV